MPRSSPTFAPLAALLLLAFSVAACASAPQAPPKPPVRELPAPATSLLVRAPLVYGDPNPIAIPDDQGSAGAQASFAAMMGGAAVHEPALDLVAAVAGRTIIEEEERPADALLQWLYWKCGATSLPGPVNVFVGPEGGEPYFQEHLRRMASILAGSREQYSFGIARIPVRGYVAQVLTIGLRTVILAPITKAQAPGARVPVRIKPAKAYANLTLYVDQGGPNVTELPMKQEGDGSFSAEAPLPAAPGRYFVEVVGVDVPPDGDVQKGWRVSLLWLPLHAGVAEPALPDDFIRHPQRNHPDPAAWGFQILNAYNSERARLGRAPLVFEQEASAVAQQRSQDIAGVADLPPPDQQIWHKFINANTPPRHLFGYVDQIEFVSEYITLRLLRPAARVAIFDPSATTLALGLSRRTVKPGIGLINSVEYIFEHIRVDPPKESARIVGELDEIETKVSGKGFEHSEPLARAAQGVVDEVCRGGPKPTDARKVFARAVGLPNTLLKRMAVPWLGYDLSRDEVSGLHEKVKGGGYTHVGVGVCQGMVDGHPNAVMALALFAGP